jgi:hypothetical protein
MIEVVIFSWVFAFILCIYLYITHKLEEKKKRLERIEILAEEISFRLLATKNHPDHEWLISKLIKTLKQNK